MELEELLGVLNPRAAVQLADSHGNAITSCAVLATSIKVSALPRVLHMKACTVLRVDSRQYPEEMGTHIEIWLDIEKEDL